MPNSIAAFFTLCIQKLSLKIKQFAVVYIFGYYNSFLGNFFLQKLILDSPVFKVAPEDVTGNLHDKVSLECKVDSNPKATYQWKFNDHFETNGPLLNIELTNTSAGTYSCEASVSGFPSISHSVRVRLRGPPRILLEHGTQFRYVDMKFRY